MKFILIVVLALITTSCAFKISRSCKCSAVSDKLHFSYHSWDISSCKLCDCSNAAIANCHESCKTMVENYAKSGCGLLTTGTTIKYKWKASDCSTGISEEEFTCV